MANPFRTLEHTSTYQFTWVGSTAPSSLGLQIKTASETVVSSVAAVQSTGGNWYAFVTVSYGSLLGSLFPVFLVAEWTATASTHVGTATPFVSRLVFELIQTKAFPQGRTQ